MSRSVNEAAAGVICPLVGEVLVDLPTTSVIDTVQMRCDGC